MKDSGINMLKDGVPFVAIASGGSLASSEITTVALAGLIIGGVGAVVAILRMVIAGLDWHEKRRANDLNILKYEDEKNDKGKDSSQAEREKESGSCKGEKAGD